MSENPPATQPRTTHPKTTHPKTTQPRTALTNVRVFDGRTIQQPGTVVIADGLIDSSTDTSGARTIDADGGVLLPGLIDAHIHLSGPETLEQQSSHGVTTALDMATWPASLVDSLRGVAGTTDIRSAGAPAIGPSGPHTKLPGMPDYAIVETPEQATAFVDARIAEDVDYLKIVLEAPGEGGPELPAARALVEAAHARNKKVVAHAASHGAYTMALRAGVDMITHIPVGPVLENDVVDRVAADATITVPTLTMMEGIATQRGNAEAFGGAVESVGALHRAGATILAGTDAHDIAGMTSFVRHGESLHHELELLVSAGMSTVEVLRAATVLPAGHFDLPDRGAVAPGLRADLVLLDGDPVADIAATRALRGVWCGGIEHATA